MDTEAVEGLTTQEAERRRAGLGRNRLPEGGSGAVARIAREILLEPMFGLLIVTTIVYLVIGDMAEGLFLLAGTVATMGLVAVQSLRSQRALEALRSLAQPLARVVRDGVETRVPAADLVPGDLLLVTEGDRIPADARLVRGDVLRLDESVLTGEAGVVLRSPGSPDGGSLLAGSLVLSGSAAAGVTATGDATQFGQIGLALSQIQEVRTPLQRSAARLVGWLAVMAIAFSLVIVLIYGLRFGRWLDGLLAGLTAAIALIPEEFPMVLTVFLAIGAWRLARRQVLVRRPAVIETLGAATLLCVDKTGTLTENRMALTVLVTRGGDRLPADSPTPEARSLLEVAALACPRSSSDPMDRAVLSLAASWDGEPDQTWPLAPERLAVIQLWRSQAGRLAAAKGAPEAIFDLCRLDEQGREPLHAVIDSLAAEGRRVLGVASARPSLAGEPFDPGAARFNFEGFLAFTDPLRVDVPGALAVARQAGVSVAMITGDHPQTALAIARQAGIDVSGGVVTGAQIAETPPWEIAALTRDIRVFARIRPDQKLALVDSFREQGHVVAMTGDGVNDAPALEAADVGVAMGRRGSDVAREAADLVLLDDSFTALVGSIRLGRRIYDNLRKALVYVSAVHVPIAGLALAPLMLGLPPMLFPAHVVLLELIIDPACALVFEAEPSARDSMRRPPRKASEPLFGLRQVATAAGQGLAILAVTLAVYAGGAMVLDPGQARGLAFVVLVTANLALALADSAASGARLFDRRRRAFWAIVTAAAAALTAALLIPALGSVLKIAPAGLLLSLAAVALGVVAGAGSRAFASGRGRGGDPSRGAG
ncbi:MAG: HAD-IC family P-type ATPase [Pseudomonadota bacterium]